MVQSRHEQDVAAANGLAGRDGVQFDEPLCRRSAAAAIDRAFAETHDVALEDRRVLVDACKALRDTGPLPGGTFTT